MKRCFAAAGAAALTCLVAPTVFAHIRVTDPAPRWTQNPKPTPCGAANVQNPEDQGPRHTFMAGETITIEWDEYTDHPGHYRIAFSEEGDAFMNPMDQEDMTDYPGVLLDGIPDMDGGMYSQEIQLPNVACDNCTLQVIQVMTEPSKAPTQGNPTNHLYFQCIDIQLMDAGAGGTGGMGGMAGSGGTGGTDVTPAGTGGMVEPTAGTGGSATTAGTGGTPPVGVGGTPAAGGTPGTAGTTAPPTAGPTGSSGGCSVNGVNGAPATSATALLPLLALLLLRRRRRSAE